MGQCVVRVIQCPEQIGKNVNERNLADAIDSFAAKHRVKAATAITAILLIPIDPIPREDR
jgi:hypothetical protein